MSVWLLVEELVSISLRLTERSDRKTCDEPEPVVTFGDFPSTKSLMPSRTIRYVMVLGSTLGEMYAFLTHPAATSACSRFSLFSLMVCRMVSRHRKTLGIPQVAVKVAPACPTIADIHPA
jgi:hypothetical protein